MSSRINIVVKAGIESGSDINAKFKYAESCCPKFERFVQENNQEDKGYFSMKLDKKHKWVEIDIADEDICEIELYDGYWGFDTYWDDYQFTNPYGEQYGIRILAKKLCDLLDQKEAWICVEDHATNSPTAPENFEEWLDYAQKIGITELNNELLLKLNTSDDYGFSSKQITHKGKTHYLSCPIYHDSFEDMKEIK